MAQTRSFLYFVFIALSAWHLKIYATPRENLIEEAKQILNTPPNEYHGKKELYDQLSHLKSQVQSDLKGGLQTASVDIYLLLDGLIDDNLKSLQSYLAFSTQEDLAKNFGSAITYSYAQKLASALKENRSTTQTQFNVHSIKEKEHCTLVINGKKQTLKNAFYGPAGIPFYVALYCKDGTFEAREVTSEPYQTRFTIRFENYEKIRSQEALLALGIPNPHPADQEQPCATCQKSQKFELPTTQSPTNFALSTGVGIDAFEKTIEDENISNANLPYGFLLYSSSKLQSQFYSFTLDVAQINRDYVVQYQTAGTLEKTTETQQGLFLRPKLGLINELRSSSYISFIGGVNAGFISASSSGQTSFHKTGGLAELTLGGRIKNETGFFMHLDSHGGINFGEISGFFVGGVMSAGLEF